MERQAAQHFMTGSGSSGFRSAPDWGGLFYAMIWMAGHISIMLMAAGSVWPPTCRSCR